MAQAAADLPVAPVVAAKKPTVRDWSTAKLTRTLRMANLCNGAYSSGAAPPRASLSPHPPHPSPFPSPLHPQACS